jgi:hypothetical protein
MIVKNDTPKTSNIFTAFILLCSIGSIYGVWYTLPFLNSWKIEGTIHCDAEMVRGNKFISHGDYFFNAKSQSNEEAFAGEFSSKIGTGEGFQYGLGINFNQFHPGRSYLISVWRKIGTKTGKSALVIMDKNKNFYFEIDKSVKEKNGWELLEKKITIPFQKEIKELKIYARSDGRAVTYFDELKIIEKEDYNSEATISTEFKPEVIELNISDKGFEKLDRKRKNALQVGILESAENDWVKGTLKSSKQPETMDIELRLKGDWLDHLKKNKWSFRVKVRDPFAWNQIKTFSLQSPKTREFLQEWVLHQWWKKEDILTPRYDFVELKLNGKSLGVYAYEEHFEKQLPEYNARREGVIVRFSEEGFWADVKKRLGDLEGNPIAHVNNSAHYLSSEVRGFKENQILNNPLLKEQFETAQSLLIDFIEQGKPVSEIFDTDKMAKYFAIVDLMQAHHSTAWHNMRFYFNPVLNKLEPVGFDGFPTYDSPFLLMSEGALSKHFKEDQEPIHYFFSDTTFLRQYIYNIFIFSEEGYLNKLLEKMDNGIASRSNFLTKEFPLYKFDKDQVFKRLSGIQSNIFPFNNLSLKAYLQKKPNGESLIQLGNIHSLPIEVIGTGFQNKKVSNYFTSPIVLPGFITSPFYKDKSRKKESISILNLIRYQIEYQSTVIPANSKFVFYKVLGYDEIFHSKILNWEIPQANSKPFAAPEKLPFSSNNLYTIKDQKVFFHSGTFKIDEDIIIPEKFVVYFSEGTHLDFIKNAKFLSYSPVQMNGKKDNPIKITSSDQSANGFTILQADGISNLECVIFENLNTHRKNNWKLTGAVTFYESEVNINDCAFLKNHCEDGLNLVRSNFEINRSIFNQTQSDGLDLDFCNGSINQSYFLNTINDGLDISGSNVYVVGCEMDNCGDKGISVGEQSNATILEATIKNSNIGIASKDLSKVFIENIHLQNCQQGFVAYQKKAEFGGSLIDVKDYTASDVKRLHNILAGCTLKLKNKLIER